MTIDDVYAISKGRLVGKPKIKLDEISKLKYQN